MNRPTKQSKVRIGTISYDVVEEQELRSGPHELDGQIDHAAGRIRLRKNLCREAKLQVFLHEIVHGITTHQRIRMKEDDIDRMATGIIQVFYDNPGLWEMIVVKGGRDMERATTIQHRAANAQRRSRSKQPK